MFNYNNNSNCAGIYKIVNVINDRVYIGQTCLFKTRFKSHIRDLTKGKHCNKFLQNDWDKCGENSFVFEVVQVIEDAAERAKAEDALLNELFDDQKQCYNLQKNRGGDYSRCFSNTPEKTRKLLQEVGKRQWENPEYVEKVMTAHKVAVTNPEYKNQMSEIVKKRNENPEFKTKMKVIHEKAKDRYLDPSFRERWDNVRKHLPAISATKLAKDYGWIISPNGEKFQVINLRKFCRDHDLMGSRSSIKLLFLGQVQQVRGWTCGNQPIDFQI